METKYCIGCKHLHFEGKSTRMGSSWTGAYTIDDARMFCKKGHWENRLPEGAMESDFERAMETALNCPDYQERPAP
jgi:hypothetical protein